MQLSMDGMPIATYPSLEAAVKAVDGYRKKIRDVAAGKPIKNSKGTLYTPRSYLGFKWRWVSA